MENPVGYLKNGSTYTVLALSTNKINFFDWAKIIVNGKEYYTTLIGGRYILNESTIPPAPENPLEIENAMLKAEVTRLKNKLTEINAISAV